MWFGSRGLKFLSRFQYSYRINYLQGDHNHLFIRQGTGLQGQAVFRTKLSFRPHSTESFTHRKMTLSLADRSQKTSGIKILSQVGVDPDQDRKTLLKVQFCDVELYCMLVLECHCVVWKALLIGYNLVFILPFQWCLVFCNLVLPKKWAKAAHLITFILNWNFKTFMWLQLFVLRVPESLFKPK